MSWLSSPIRIPVASRVSNGMSRCWGAGFGSPGSRHGRGPLGAWTLGGQFDSPVTGRVGLNAGVVKDLLERADVGLDRGGGEPLFGEGCDELAAVLPVEAGWVSVLDVLGERAAALLVDVAA